MDLDSEIDASFSEGSDTEVEEKGSEGKDGEDGEKGSKEKSGKEVESDESKTDDKEEKDEDGNPVKKEAEPSKKPEKVSRADKRVAEVLQQRYQDRKEIAELREKLSRFEKDGPEPPKKPDPKDFEYDPKDPESVKAAQRKFDFAMGKYEKDLEHHKEKVEAAKEEKEGVEKKRIENERAIFASKIEEGKKQYTDFDEAFASIKDSFEITEALHYTLLDSKDPAGVLRHLGKNPELAGRIFDLPTTRQAIYLAKIDLKLKYDKDRKVKAASSAPAPAAKVAGSGGAKKDPRNMTAREWADYKAKEDKKT